MSPETITVKAIHLERNSNGVNIVTVLLPDGSELEAIRDGQDLITHTAYAKGSYQWPTVKPDERFTPIENK